LCEGKTENRNSSGLAKEKATPLLTVHESYKTEVAVKVSPSKSQKHYLC